MLEARHVYYLKLGRGGRWAADSIAHGRARIGWARVPLQKILDGAWDEIREDLNATSKTAGAGTMDANALEIFSTSTQEDVWITFHDSRLWWGRLGQGIVQEDATSKFRLLAEGWSPKSLKGEVLRVNQIPGRIAQLQGFRGTVCRVRERDALLRLLSGERSPEYAALVEAKNAMVARTMEATRGLHWKDFELLVDLVFRQSGWRRVSVVGESMKSADIELVDPITGDRYQVQVKSQATRATASAYREDCTATAFRKLFFVVHSPDAGLSGAAATLGDESFEIVLPERLATMVVDAGLTAWLLDRIA